METDDDKDFAAIIAKALLVEAYGDIINRATLKSTSQRGVMAVACKSMDIDLEIGDDIEPIQYVVNYNTTDRGIQFSFSSVEDSDPLACEQAAYGLPGLWKNYTNKRDVQTNNGEVLSEEMGVPTIQSLPLDGGGEIKITLAPDEGEASCTLEAPSLSALALVMNVGRKKPLLPPDPRHSRGGN